MSYVSWQWKIIQKLKRNWLVVLKLTWGTPQILTRALESLKNFCFNWLLVTKVYILFELQKYRGVIFYDTEEICKFWRKTDLWFEKRLEKFGKFSPPIRQEENISGKSIERSLLIYFENFQGAPCSHRQSRNRMMNTFIIVNITPTCRRDRV